MFGKKKQEDPDLVTVRTASDNFELGIIQGLLEDNDIPFMVKERESGNYMKILMGMSIFGSDVIIAKENLEKAKEVLAVLDIEEDEVEEVVESEE